LVARIITHYRSGGKRKEKGERREDAGEMGAAPSIPSSRGRGKGKGGASIKTSHDARACGTEGGGGRKKGKEFGHYAN